MKIKFGKYAFIVILGLLSYGITGCGESVSNSESESSREIYTRQTSQEESGTEIETEAESEADSSAEEDSLSVESNTEASESNVTGYMYRGTIYDTNGIPLLYTVQEDVQSAYREINDLYSLSLSNILADSASGLDTTFEDILRTSNPTAVNAYNNIGRSVQITIDAEMQNNIYARMESENIIGSVVVMRADGSILAQVSYPSYDDNLYKNDSEYRESLSGTGAFNNRTLLEAAPGSSFKILSEVLADKNGITELTDEGVWTVDGAAIHNWDYDTNSNYPIEQRTLQSAFRNSSNVFFAKAFDTIGEAQVIQDLEEIFLFGDSIEITCDFGELSNTLMIENADDLRRSGFGQANVRTTPMYLAAVTRKAVFGTMVRPFVLQNIVDTADYTQIISEGSTPNEEIASIPMEYRENLKNAMYDVGSDLAVTPIEGYTLYAKTGTAEVGSGDYLYIAGCLLNANDSEKGTYMYENYSTYNESGSYIIVLQIQNPDALALEYASGAAYIYSDLMNIVVGNEKEMWGNEQK